MRVIPHSGRELSLAMAIIFNTLAEDVHTTPQGSTATQKVTPITRAQRQKLSHHTSHTFTKTAASISSSLLKLFLRTAHVRVTLTVSPRPIFPSAALLLLIL